MVVLVAIVGEQATELAALWEAIVELRRQLARHNGQPLSQDETADRCRHPSVIRRRWLGTSSCSRTLFRLDPTLQPGAYRTLVRVAEQLPNRQRLEHYVTEEWFILDPKVQRHKVGSGGITTHFLSLGSLCLPPPRFPHLLP